MSYERIIARAIMGKLDKKTAEHACSLLSAVQTQMFCKCGNILDVKSSVYYETPQGRPVTVRCGECHASFKKDSANLLSDAVEAGWTIVDGTALHSEKVL